MIQSTSEGRESKIHSLRCLVPDLIFKLSITYQICNQFWCGWSGISFQWNFLISYEAAWLVITVPLFKKMVVKIMTRYSNSNFAVQHQFVMTPALLNRLCRHRWLLVQTSLRSWSVWIKRMSVVQRAELWDRKHVLYCCLSTTVPHILLKTWTLAPTTNRCNC